MCSSMFLCIPLQSSNLCSYPKTKTASHHPMMPSLQNSVMQSNTSSSACRIRKLLDVGRISDEPNSYIIYIGSCCGHSRFHSCLHAKCLIFLFKMLQGRPIMQKTLHTALTCLLMLFHTS